MIEIGTYDYKVRLDESSGKAIYRVDTYKNKDNWMDVTDIKLVKSMVERIKGMEESIDYYQEELDELREISNFISIYKSLIRDKVELYTQIFIHDSHMGGWYYTLSDIDHERCEQ